MNSTIKQHNVFIRSHLISDEIKLNRSCTFSEDSHTFMQPGNGRPFSFTYCKQHKHNLAYALFFIFQIKDLKRSCTFFKGVPLFNISQGCTNQNQCLTCCWPQMSKGLRRAICATSSLGKDRGELVRVRCALFRAWLDILISSPIGSLSCVWVQYHKAVLSNKKKLNI